MRRYVASAMIGIVLLSACGRKPEIARIPPAPRTLTPLPLVMPSGAYIGMQIPALMSDGRYLTPNRNLSADGAVWHLRAALNVAALACRGPDEAMIVAGYNALLNSRKATLNNAQTHLAAGYKVQGGDWQDRYDDEMTRLYNFFSQAQARDGFCHVAAATLADSAAIAEADFPAFASKRLAMLEKPFTDFYAAYDAWRAASTAANGTATVSTAQAAPREEQAIPAAIPAARPRLELDPSTFLEPNATVTH